jgi:hypothetical protein
MAAIQKFRNGRGAVNRTPRGRSVMLCDEAIT